MSWGIWAIIVVVLLIMEVLATDFTFLMFAGGALGATITSLVTGSWVPQLIVFIVVSVLLLFFVRPWAKRFVNSTSHEKTNVDAMAGKIARTLTVVDARGGRAKVGGDVWSALSAGGEIPAGVDVPVVKVNGAHLVLAALAPVEGGSVTLEAPGSAQ